MHYVSAEMRSADGANGQGILIHIVNITLIKGPLCKMQLRLTLTNCINQLGGIFGANMHSFCLSLAIRLMLFNFFKEAEA